MASYGPVILGLALFLAELGLPIPTAALVLAAGGFGRLEVIDWWAAFLIGLASVVLGDCTGYALGRFAGNWAQGPVKHWRPTSWQTSRNCFRQYGALTVFLTRTLLTSFDVPTNLIAGGSQYAFPRFLACDLLGRAIWITTFGGLGYLFGCQWPVISQIIHRYSFWIGGLVIICIGLFLFLRWAGFTTVGLLPKLYRTRRGRK